MYAHNFHLELVLVSKIISAVWSSPVSDSTIRACRNFKSGSKNVIFNDESTGKNNKFQKAVSKDGGEGEASFHKLVNGHVVEKAGVVCIRAAHWSRETKNMTKILRFPP